MKNYTTTTYGEAIAGDYDELYAELDVTSAVDTLAQLAGGGRVLELGIGTGRVALPLAAKGLQVVGIDSSEAMVAKLRAKPGGSALEVVLGELSEAAVPGKFSLVFVAFNTLFMLPTQEAQVRCFRSAAARLAPGGRFVIEAFVPDLARFTNGQALKTMRVEADVVALEAMQHDRVKQTVDGQVVMIRESGIRLFPAFLRYAWPSELDLMGQLAGLRLEERWGGWDRRPFTAESGQHVCVYQLP